MPLRWLTVLLAAARQTPAMDDLRSSARGAREYLTKRSRKQAASASRVHKPIAQGDDSAAPAAVELVPAGVARERSANRRALLENNHKERCCAFGDRARSTSRSRRRKRSHRLSARTTASECGSVR